MSIYAILVNNLWNTIINHLQGIQSSIILQKMSVLLKVTHFHFSYGKKAVLKNIDFSVNKGEVVCLLGPNGAGKTTLISCMLGLLKKQTGSIEVFGESPDSLLARKKIGATPQELDFPNHLKVSEILSSIGSHFENPYPIEKLKKSFRLEKIWNQACHTLSGGEKRRLALACAFIGRPELVYLDEPTNGVDIESRGLLLETIKEFVKLGTSIVLTTHYLDEAEKLADRVILLNDGKIIWDGKTDAMLSLVQHKKIKFSAPYNEALVAKYHFHWNNDCYSGFVHETKEFIHDLAQSNIQFSDLEIQGARLEEAFVHLLENQL